MNLLKRVVAGLGRRSDVDEEDIGARPVDRAAPADRSSGRTSAPRSHDSQDPLSKYAPRSTPHGLDPHGRQSPVHNTPDEDELDIPAFLRRQSK